jgi:hypothetical protein
MPSTSRHSGQADIAIRMFGFRSVAANSARSAAALEKRHSAEIDIIANPRM